jgi:hypothetical protein
MPEGGEPLRNICVTHDHGYVPLVVFRHRLLLTVLAILFRAFVFPCFQHFEIIWFYNLLSVPDEVSARNTWCALNKISIVFFLQRSDLLFIIYKTKFVLKFNECKELVFHISISLIEGCC